jgi:sugar/nucleoside kinase (ribokinase family)
VLVRDAAPAGEHAPAISSVYVEERTGDRSVVSVNGAATAPVPPPGLGLDGARVVLVDGHHPELALAAVRLARRHGVPVVLDGGSWKPVLEALLPLVDVAICSADFRAPGAATSDAAAADLRARGVPAVAVTRGGEPVRWWSGTEAGEVAVPRVRAVDTLGAGDTFHGAFCYALAAAPRRALAAQLRFAAEVAAVRCGVAGLRAWLAEPAVRELAAAWRSVDDRS